jgi:hypothetical protein
MALTVAAMQPSYPFFLGLPAVNGKCLESGSEPQVSIFFQLSLYLKKLKFSCGHFKSTTTD